MIVIDASVALKWVLDEDDSPAARKLHSTEMGAPALWLVEAGNALWRLASNKTITTAFATAALKNLLAAPVARIPIEGDLNQALEISIRLRHPIYDCTYLAAALREDTHVVTADTRFVAATARDAKLKNRVRLLSA